MRKTADKLRELADRIDHPKGPHAG
jgi:hypothetical protein